jgi:diadenosine tetraphosphate (Ap4A) HIT family hydrolase
MQPPTDCVICRGVEGDEELDRVEVWQEAGWRMSMARHGPTLGFSYLEPIRHIAYLADLDGEESASLGSVLGRASASLREATGAGLVYAYVFGGGVPHLHFHLAPNIPEGVLNTALIEGRIEERHLPSGATEIISLDHPDLPAEELATVIDRVREGLGA